MTAISAQEAEAYIRQGDVVALPTEHMYALCVDATNPRAVERLRRLKGRRLDHPLPVFVDGVDMVRNFRRELPNGVQSRATRHWPGLLTMVVRCDNQRLVSVGREDEQGLWVGFRQPNVDLVRQLVAELGRPITATSANLTGEPAALSVAEVNAHFGNAVACVDGGVLKGGMPSTVLQIDDNGGAIIVRPGALSEEALRNGEHHATA